MTRRSLSPQANRVLRGPGERPSGGPDEGLRRGRRVVSGFTAPRIATAVLGPTNTGKTHLAIERMLGHPTGMIGLPLRLLARASMPTKSTSLSRGIASAVQIQ
jgi:hypothetical protein